MGKLFTEIEQLQHFELGKQHFLNGNYAEAEVLLRLVMESAQQLNDYKTYVSSITWLNRTFINTSQFEQLYTMLLRVHPLLEKYATSEDAYFYRLHLCIFNSFYSIGDSITEFTQLFEDLSKTEHTMLTYITGCNLLYTLFEHERIDQGIALLHKLEELSQTLDSINNITLYMQSIYAFLLYFSNEDYEKAAAIIQKIEQTEYITIVESFAYLFYICKALIEAQIGDIQYAKKLFHDTLPTVKQPEHIRQELKLWVKTLEKANLTDEVIYYQRIIIQLLEAQYTSDVKKLRKELIEQLSLQYYEGQLYVDQLTNTYNRNYYENLLSKQQQVKNYTVVVLDIDHFKRINDQFGHSTGDMAIKFIAAQLNNWSSKHDIAIVRYGGDEFTILIPYSFANIENSLYDLHHAIMSTPLHVPKQNLDIPLSVSMGVGFTDNIYLTINHLFELADAAIYEAKKTRGKVVVKQHV